MTDKLLSDARSPLNPADAGPVACTPYSVPYSALAFDAEAYLAFLADCDWTDEQKREFIEALWQIVLNFVDMGFSAHPLQLLPKSLEVDSPGMLALGDNSEIGEMHGATIPNRDAAGRKDS